MLFIQEIHYEIPPDCAADNHHFLDHVCPEYPRRHRSATARRQPQERQNHHDSYHRSPRHALPSPVPKLTHRGPIHARLRSPPGRNSGAGAPVVAPERRPANYWAQSRRIRDGELGANDPLRPVSRRLERLQEARQQFRLRRDGELGVGVLAVRLDRAERDAEVAADRFR